jgi:hypothetical protein
MARETVSASDFIKPTRALGVRADPSLAAPSIGEPVRYRPQGLEWRKRARTGAGFGDLRMADGT